MKSFTVIWQPVNTTYIAAEQIAVEGIPLTFSNPIPFQNIFTGGVTYSMNMPVGTTRQITITNNGLVDAATFDIVGADSFGNILDETIDIPAGEMTASVNYYAVINSAIMTTANNVEVSIGLGNLGYINPVMMDMWNKTSAYTVSFTNVIDNEIEFTPTYSNFNVNNFVNYQLVRTTFVFEQNLFRSVDIPNYPVTLPIGPDSWASFSVIQMPLSVLSAQILGGTGGMTVTFTQQGARV
jgi:hypothetical protein